MMVKYRLFGARSSPKTSDRGAAARCEIAYSAMHLKSSFWGGFIQEMIHSDIGGLLNENRQGIPPTWGEFDVVAPQECDCHPSPPARALGSLGLHCRGAAGEGGGAAFGPQPRYRGILGPTLQRPWAHWPAAQVSRPAWHLAQRGGIDRTEGRRAASAASGRPAHRGLVGERGRGICQTHFRENHLQRHRAAVSAPSGVPAQAAAQALRQGRS